MAYRITLIPGDGTGPDIWRASVRVFDAAVEKAYGGQRKVHWAELYLGEKAAGIYDGDYFPAETLDAIRELTVAIKGPLTTPVGGGIRSLNVALSRSLDDDGDRETVLLLGGDLVVLRHQNPTIKGLHGPVSRVQVQVQIARQRLIEPLFVDRLGQVLITACQTIVRNIFRHDIRSQCNNRCI